jgi:hypothetical protein
MMDGDFIKMMQASLQQAQQLELKS